MAMSLLKKTANLTKHFKRMLKDDSGNMAIMMGYLAPLMILAIGSVTDFQRAMEAKAAAQVALDSATIYAAHLPDKNSAILRSKTQAFFDQNFIHDASIVVRSYNPSDGGDHILGKAQIEVNTYFSKFVGLDTLVADVESKVFKSGINLEVALVLDNTGSMDDAITPATGNLPITDLKLAAAKFVDTIMPTTQGQFYTKIAAIPYSNSVNLGSLAASARGTIATGTSSTPGSANYTFTNAAGNSKTLPITNCVSERIGSNAYNDTPFTSASRAGRAYLNANNPCAVKELIPLSTDGGALKATIDQMAAGGSTAVQVGLGWGWYALSPTIGMWSGTAQPAGYDKITTTDRMTKVKKVLVIMTDAESNSSFFNGVISGNPYKNGTGGTADLINQAPTNGSSYTQATSICNAIKATGIEIYVITFQLNKTVAERVKMVSDCATDAQHIKDADTGGIDSAFAEIANAIQDIRIAQ
jgi:Flp pilus assembly protein TadG